MFTNLPQCSQSTNSLIYVYSIQILSCFLWVLDHNCDHYSSYYCCPPKISVLAPLMYGSWDIRHNSRQSFLLIWAIFCPLTSYQPEKLKFWKKKPGDITILNLCTTNDDEMYHNHICMFLGHRVWHRLVIETCTIALVQAGTQANQFASTIDRAGKLYQKSCRQKFLFFLKTQKNLVLIFFLSVIRKVKSWIEQNILLLLFICYIHVILCWKVL